MSDLIERLREIRDAPSGVSLYVIASWCGKASDALEAKDQRIAELECALDLALDEWDGWMDNVDADIAVPSCNPDRELWHEQRRILNKG